MPVTLKFASVVVLLTFLSQGQFVLAQSAGNQTGQSQNGASDAAPAGPRGGGQVAPGGPATTPLEIALTGCLRRTGADNGFYLADQNGTTWKLTSDSVQLSEHMNQSVTVSGKPIRTPRHQETFSPQAGQTTGSSESQPILRVLSITVLSRSCTR